jgi:hypothetical protein
VNDVILIRNCRCCGAELPVSIEVIYPASIADAMRICDACAKNIVEKIRASQEKL